MDAAGMLTEVGVAWGMLTPFAVVGWRQYRKAQQERTHQTRMLNAVHGGLFGRAEEWDNGVRVQPEQAGVIAQVERLQAIVTNGLTTNVTKAAEDAAAARVAAGQAAALAAAAEERATAVRTEISAKVDRLTQDVNAYADIAVSAADAIRRELHDAGLLDDELGGT